MGECVKATERKEGEVGMRRVKKAPIPQSSFSSRRRPKEEEEGGGG